MKKYILQHSTWPDLYWDNQTLASLVIKSRQKQSFLLGAANMLGFDLKLQAQGVILEKEVIETAAIEGEMLNPESVRSSVARQLGLPTAGMRAPDRKTNGIVEVLLDAVARADNEYIIWYLWKQGPGQSLQQKI